MFLKRFQSQTALFLLILLLPLLFLAAFFFYPLINIFRLTLTTESVTDVVNRPYILQVAWFTFWQAAVSTGLTLLLGLPAAYLFARYEFPGRNLLRALATVPFVMPTVVVAAAFRTLLGNNGPVNQALMALAGRETPVLHLEQTLTIILIAHVFYNFGVVIRLVGGFWANLNPRMVEAAQVLGASPWKAFRTVTLPLLQPPLMSASLLVFLFTFTSFGVILLLGGPGFSTLETEIYRQYVTFLEPSVAAVLSILQIGFTFLLMSLYSHWQQRSAVALDFRPQETTRRQPRTTGQRIAILALVVGVCLFLLTPLLTLAIRSFVGGDGRLTLAYYEALPVSRRGSVTFIPPLAAVGNSLGYAVLTVLTAGFLGLLTALVLARPSSVRRWLEPVFMLPLGASAVTLGLG
ncbi:MAG: ABC transporter permease subunit, partial [Candidatus Promineifilaceae bacterium]